VSGPEASGPEAIGPEAICGAVPRAVPRARGTKGK